MTNRKAEILILCEDLQQEVFARSCLIAYGFNRRKIRSLKSPKGKGAGSQFVLESFPNEVRVYRSRSANLALFLVVLIDADNYTHRERLSHLENTLINAGLAPRMLEEKIAVFIPKRNIETWIHYSMHEVVNEENIYPKLSNQSDCKPYLENLIAQCREDRLIDPPPSLQHGRAELRRIL